MNLKEIKKVVGALQSQLFKNSNSFSVGMLKSHFKGAGLQFKEHQVYALGDDVRFIDWKLSAKTNNTFIKTFEEERNIEIVVCIDISDTLKIGFEGVSKMQVIIELTCLLYLLAEKSKDRVRVIVFGNNILNLPPISGNEGIALLVSTLERENILTESGKVNLQYNSKNEISESKRLGLLKNYVAKKKEVVYLSDLKNIENVDELAKLTSKRNMHTFQILSPIDIVGNSKYSILSRRMGKSTMMSATSGKDKIATQKIKKINVKDRYLEEFVREML